MATEYYECHITLQGSPRPVEKAVIHYGWKFSSIDGDPVLGDGVKCYATKQFNGKYDANTILLELNRVGDILHAQGETTGKWSVVRRKIEKVIYDTKSSKVDLGESL